MLDFIKDKLDRFQSDSATKMESFLGFVSGLPGPSMTAKARRTNVTTCKAFKVTQCRRATKIQMSSTDWDTQSDWNMPTLESDWRGLWKPQNMLVVEGKPGVGYNPPLKIDDSLMLEICRQQTPESWPNEILWTMLGYKKDEGVSQDEKDLTKHWVATDMVVEEWKSEFPVHPPDFIGKRDCYDEDVDKPIKKAAQKLTRTIPKEYKQLLKEDLGFEGFTIAQLTPQQDSSSHLGELDVVLFEGPWSPLNGETPRRHP